MWSELCNMVYSRNSDLQAEALAIFSLCVKNYIRIEPEWIPREQNELVDYCSRLVDYDDWRLNPVVFQWLDELWGPHTVDRSALCRSCKCPDPMV